jgi:transcriptional regulator with XRE-family HTH domain
MTTDTAHDIPELTLGWRLRMAMERSGLDQSEWAEYLGVNRTTITRWTHDKGPVARGHLIAISLRTGVPIEWIETGTGPQTSNPGGGQRARRDSNSQPSDLEFGALRTRIRRSYASQLAAA